MQALSCKKSFSTLQSKFPSKPWLQDRRRKTAGIFLILIMGCLMAFFVGLGLGAIRITPLQCLAILVSKLGITLPIKFQTEQTFVLCSIRLPRILAGGMVGAGLGLAGAAMQGLFRNPLADPGLVGVSSGAAIGAVLILVLGPTFLATAGLFVPWAAFCGALSVGWITHRLAQREGRILISTLLLSGIAVNALCGAGIGLLTYLATDAQLRNITFWSLGSLGGITWNSIGWLALFILPAAGGLFNQRRTLNILLLGEAEAGHLGVPIERGKRIILFCTALIVGASVSFAGMIGFVGLVVPHLLRLWGGPDHRFLLPSSAILGALLLVIADTTARLIVIPSELPIGIVTAFCGAPFFLWLLKKEGGRI
ncbi:MAG: heme ABC transporter permease [Verrucomicrobia bacterium]|nr:MAG: heme ABC transporter permease [Verrucomicrobiota bacterium]